MNHPLFEAITQGRWAECLPLIEQAEDHPDTDWFCLAVSNGAPVEVADALYVQGYDAGRVFNYVCYNGGSAEMIEYLLSRGAEASDHAVRLALRSIRDDTEKTLLILMRHGADVFGTSGVHREFTYEPLAPFSAPWELIPVQEVRESPKARLARIMLRTGTLLVLARLPVTTITSDILRLLKHYL